jgi:HEAT repeat protein
LAVDALATIREPKVIPELRAIWQKSNDLVWNTAAIRALGRLGQADIASRLLELAQDLKGPLTARHCSGSATLRRSEHSP